MTRSLLDWRWLLLVSAWTLAGMRSSADELKRYELAGKAFHVLQSRCFKCHGQSSGQARGDVHVLNVAKMLSSERPLIVAGHPEHSALIDLVEAGAMPHGREPKLGSADRKVLRDWVAAGAPAFQGDEYVLGTILEDVESLRVTDRPRYRYVSLNHLLGASDPGQELKNQQTLLTETLRFLSGDKGLRLRFVDAPETVIRLDLRQLGWDTEPFVVVEKKGSKETLGAQSSLNLFDLLLLEYPYGYVPHVSETFPRLATAYLAHANPIRPLAYVRGDWLISRVAQAPFDKELRIHSTDDSKLTDKVRAFEQRAVNRDMALAELGQPLPAGALEELWQRELAPLGHGETVPRFVWEKAFAGVVVRARLGQPILRLDDLARTDVPADPPLEVTMQKMAEQYVKDNKAKTGLRVAVKNHSARRGFFELVFSSSSGKLFNAAEQVQALAGNEEQRFPRTTLPYNLIGGTGYFTLYAADKQFPAGKVLRANGFKDRFIHADYYDIDAAGHVTSPFFPMHLIRKSIDDELLSDRSNDK